MGPHLIIGIMGPGEKATAEDKRIAFEAGRIIAKEGYVLLTGGRNCGVMDASLKGAKKEKGLTIGILPGEETSHMSKFVDIPILTGLGNARNAINVLSSRVIIAIGQGPGTFSEVSMAIKIGKPIMALNIRNEVIKIFNQFTTKPIYALNYFEPKVFRDILVKTINET